jgi:uncharacterized protein YecT (DUF1311 family)
MKTIQAITCFVLLVVLAPAQGIDDLQKSFWDRLAAKETAKDEDLRQLNKSYEAALQRLMEDSQKTGKLDEVLILREQIANIEQDNDAAPKASEAKGVEDMLPLREKYTETRAEILEKHATEVVALVDRANSLLEEQIIALTKAGKIGEAVKAKQTLDKIAEDKSILAARGAIPIDPEKVLSELTRNLEETTWEWQSTNRKAKKGGALLKLGKGGVAEFSWNPERGQWKVVSASEVELKTAQWDDPVILNLDEDLNRWKINRRGKVSVRGKRVQQATR